MALKKNGETVAVSPTNTISYHANHHHAFNSITHAQALTTPASKQGRAA